MLWLSTEVETNPLPMVSLNNLETDRFYAILERKTSHFFRADDRVCLHRRVKLDFFLNKASFLLL